MVYRLPKLKISNGRCQAIGPSYIGSSQGSLLGPVLFVLFIEKLLCVYEEKDLDEVILDKLTWDPHLHLEVQQRQIICYVCLRDHVPCN